MAPYRLPDPYLESLLQDDTPCGDATTHALGIGKAKGCLEFRARGPMTVCGSEEAVRLGELRGLSAFGDALASGSTAAPGELLLALVGPAAGLHAVWKTAQTLMEYLSGIATATAAIVSEARAGHVDTAVACTRKNFPGTKQAAVKAVLAGGAVPHRLSLSETILIFAEHRAFLGDEAPAATVARIHRLWPERAVVAEVATLAEASVWIAAGVDVLQTEKMAPEAVAATASLATEAPRRPLIAAAGGITAKNARAYAEAGARLLVTSSPYFAPPRDVAVTLSST